MQLQTHNIHRGRARGKNHTLEVSYSYGTDMSLFLLQKHNSRNCIIFTGAQWSTTISWRRKKQTLNLAPQVQRWNLFALVVHSVWHIFDQKVGEQVSVKASTVWEGSFDCTTICDLKANYNPCTEHNLPKPNLNLKLKKKKQFLQKKKKTLVFWCSTSASVLTTLCLHWSMN